MPHAVPEARRPNIAVAESAEVSTPDGLPAHEAHAGTDREIDDGAAVEAR